MVEEKIENKTERPLYGGRLPDVGGLHWVGNESWGHFEDDARHWINPMSEKSHPVLDNKLPPQDREIGD